MTDCKAGKAKLDPHPGANGQNIRVCCHAFAAVLSLLPLLSAQSTGAATQPVTVTVSSFGFDTSAALQAAVNKVAREGGGTVQLQPGIYPLQRMVNLTNIKNVSIVGYGATIRAAYRMTVTQDGDLIRVQDADHISILGITFDGDSKSRGFNGAPQTIRLNWSRDVLIADCSFKNAVCDDIFMWGGLNPSDAERICHRVQITRCTFDNANRNAISVVNATHVRIDHNLMQNVRHNDPQAGVDVEPNWGDPPGVARDILIDNNRVVTCGYAITTKQVDRPSNIWIIGNQIEHCRYGIGNEAANCDIEWNTISDSETFAIAAGSGGTATIQNNTAIRCATGIYAEPGNVVKSNTIK
jgi:hypothetical protein